jgi:YD repeat-containing protein
MSVTLFLAPMLHADERTFSAAVDGKSSGTFTVTSKTHPDEVTEIRARFDIGDRSYEGAERWRRGRLVRLEGSGTESGRTRSASLIDGKDGYALTSGIKEITVRGDVWPTSFWIKPAAEKLLIVDVFTGEVSRGKLDKVGPEQMQIDGKLVRVTKYRLTFAGETTELSYDQADRLTRRKCEAKGRSIVIELTGVRAD